MASSQTMSQKFQSPLMNHGLHGRFVSRQLDHHRPCIHLSCTFDGRWAPGSLDGRVTARRRLPLWLLHLSGTQHGDAAGGIRYLAKTWRDWFWRFWMSKFQEVFSEAWRIESFNFPQHNCLVTSGHVCYSSCIVGWRQSSTEPLSYGCCTQFYCTLLEDVVETAPWTDLLEFRPCRVDPTEVQRLIQLLMVWWCFICANLLASWLFFSPPGVCLWSPDHTSKQVRF